MFATPKRRHRRSASKQAAGGVCDRLADLLRPEFVPAVRERRAPHTFAWGVLVRSVAGTSTYGSRSSWRRTSRLPARRARLQRRVIGRGARHRGAERFPARAESRGAEVYAPSKSAYKLNSRGVPPGVHCTAREKLWLQHRDRTAFPAC